MRRPATSRQRISLEKTGEEGKTMFLADGKLYVLGGDKDPGIKLKTPYPGMPTSTTALQENNTAWGCGGYKPGTGGWGSRIAAYDFTTGKDLWVHAEEKPINARAIGLAGGKLFFYAEKSRIGCLDASTGRLLWSNSEESVLASLEHAPFLATNSSYGLMCTPQAVYIARAPEWPCRPRTAACCGKKRRTVAAAAFRQSTCSWSAASSVPVSEASSGVIVCWSL